MCRMQNLLAGTTFSPHILPCDEVDATESGDAGVADDVEDDASLAELSFSTTATHLGNEGGT